LNELEEEVTAFMKSHPESEAIDLSENLGLSRSGAAFLIAKVRGGKGKS
jgi:hypothetical protein